MKMNWLMLKLMLKLALGRGSCGRFSNRWEAGIFIWWLRRGEYLIEYFLYRCVWESVDVEWETVVFLCLVWLFNIALRSIICSLQLLCDLRLGDVLARLLVLAVSVLLGLIPASLYILFLKLFASWDSALFSIFMFPFFNEIFFHCVAETVGVAIVTPLVVFT